MKYTQIPTTTFQNIQLNAGILVDDFNVETGVIGRILGATTGGVAFADSVEFTDFGDDIDNCPKNMLELKKLESHEVTLGGTFVTINPETAKDLIGAADVDELDERHIVPRNDLATSDFKTIWWIGDYSDVNTGNNAGFVAIKLLNALNTGGFSIQSTDNGKGQFAFSFMGHYSMDAQDVVPYEIYIKGSDEPFAPSITLDAHSVTIDVDATLTLHADVVPAGTTITWTSSNGTVASVAAGVVTGEAAGNAIITASITVEGVTYTDTCTVIVEGE